SEIARILERPPPKLQFPVAAIYPLALGAELWSYASGGEPFVTRDALRMARHRMFFKDIKARRELAYHSRPYQEGIVDAIAWFRKAGYLSDRRLVDQKSE